MAWDTERADGDVYYAADHNETITQIKAKATIANPTFTGTAVVPTLDTGVAAAGVTLTGTTLAADGTDANIPINITSKGTSQVVIGPNASVAGVVPVEASVGFTLEGGTTSKTLTVDETISISGKMDKAANVTSINDTGIADGEICLFNATNKDIRTSDKTIVTTLGADDLTVPTSKAIVDALGTGPIATVLAIAVKAAAQLRKGQAVYITPGAAATADVNLCDPRETAKSRILGVASADIASAGTGTVIRGGTLANVDTRRSSAGGNGYTNVDEIWTEGQLLYVHPTSPGHLTNVVPKDVASSGRTVKVGYTVKGNSATDSLVIFPMENPVRATAASTEDVILRLGDNSGTNKVSVRDYANNEVASINSDGVIKGTINDYIKLDPIGCMIPTTAPAGIDQAESGAGAGNYVYGLFTYAGIGAPGTGNNLQWRVILPEDWSAAGLVSAKVHWLPTAGTASEYVKWHIEATQLAEGDVISTAFSSLGTCEDQLLATPAGKVHISPACTPQAIAGNAGNEVIFRVTRIAAQATASNQDIRLLGVSIKYIRTLA